MIIKILKKHQIHIVRMQIKIEIQVLLGQMNKWKKRNHKSQNQNNL